MILASIVEKETGKPSERRTVAGVYCNRLRIGMKLDADPTVIYPITKGKPLGRRIRRSELAADTGYNTYKKPGLPVGPDRQSGRATASPRCSTRRRPRRSISSPTAPAAMCSPKRFAAASRRTSPNGTRSAARAARCDAPGRADGVPGDIADAALLAGVAPGPAEAVVEHRERLAGLELERALRPRPTARREASVARDHRPIERLGIMRGDHPVGERDVGEVVAIGVEGGVGRIRRPGSAKPSALVGEGRRLADDRPVGRAGCRRPRGGCA